MNADLERFGASGVALDFDKHTTIYSNLNARGLKTTNLTAISANPNAKLVLTDANNVVLAEQTGAVTYTLPLANGINTFKVTVQPNGAGAEPKTYEFHVTNVAAGSGSVSLTTVSPGTRGWWNSHSVPVVLHANNLTNFVPTSVQFQVNDGDWATKSYSTSPFSVTTLTGEGTHVVRAALHDADNYTLAANNLTIQIDTTAPIFASDTSAVNFAENEQSLNVSVEVSDALSGIYTVVAFKDGHAHVMQKETDSNKYSVSFAASDRSGVSIVATDWAGNQRRLQATEPTPSTDESPDTQSPPLPVVDPGLTGVHYAVTLSPDGTLTKMELELSSEVLSTGRTLKRIGVPTNFAETLRKDREAGSEVAEIRVEAFEGERQPVIEITVPGHVLEAAAGISLILATPHGQLTLPPQLVSALGAAQQPLLITIDRQPLNEIGDVLPVGVEAQSEALSVATDLKGRTTVTMSVHTDLPENDNLRKAYLDELMVYAMHSSGSKEMIHNLAYDIQETTYTDEQGIARISYTLRSISFDVTEFSHFVVVQPRAVYLSTIVGSSGYTIAGVIRSEMVPCYYKGNDTMMPIRMLEDFGVNFQWDESTKTATMAYRQKTIRLTIGSTDAYINGEKIPIVGASATVRGDS